MKSEKGAADLTQSLSTSTGQIPISTSAGQNLLLEVVFKQAPSHPDFCTSTDHRKTSCWHSSEKNWQLKTTWQKLSCIHPTNVCTETGLNAVFSPSTHPLPRDLETGVFRNQPEVLQLLPSSSSTAQTQSFWTLKAIALLCTRCMDPVP